MTKPNYPYPWYPRSKPPKEECDVLLYIYLDDWHGQFKVVGYWDGEAFWTQNDARADEATHWTYLPYDPKGDP